MPKRLIGENTMVQEVTFKVGGRYRNRLGWYEVLNITGDKMHIRYESDGHEDNVSLATQKRIIENITNEEKRVTPYETSSENQRYFMTLGFLVRHGFIEAIIPPKSEKGFVENYFKMKGRRPRQDNPGYYLHRDIIVNKWGIEMRLTFTIPRSINLSELDFGGAYNLVESPDPEKLRINSNELCYRLLEIGYDLGVNHDMAQIEANVPQQYRDDFKRGLSID